MRQQYPLTPNELALNDAATRDDQPEVERLTTILDDENRARTDRLTSPTSLRDAALWYATQGLPVFPCLPGGKAPLTKHGFHDATIDHTTIHAWWTRNPDANIGLPTGRRYDVVDIDTPNGLIGFYDQFIDTGGFPPIRAIAITPRGRHLYIDATPGRTNKAGIIPGVDIRASGGYVVAPPSSTPDGVYRWVRGNELNPGEAR